MERTQQQQVGAVLGMEQAAQQGYEGGSSPFMLSSPLDMAWRAGGWCYHARMGQPIKCSMGRGYKVNVETRKGKAVLDFKNDSRVPTPVSMPLIDVLHA